MRYACCNAIGQMSTDFAPVFEKKFHARVVPGLLHLMDDTANPRVQAHAGAALVNFRLGEVGLAYKAVMLGFINWRVLWLTPAPSLLTSCLKGNFLPCIRNICITSSEDVVLVGSAPLPDCQLLRQWSRVRIRHLSHWKNMEGRQSRPLCI